VTVQPLRPGLEPIMPDPQRISPQTADWELPGSTSIIGAAGDEPIPSWEGACTCPDDCPRDHGNE